MKFFVLIKSKLFKWSTFIQFTKTDVLWKFQNCTKELICQILLFALFYFISSASCLETTLSCHSFSILFYCYLLFYLLVNKQISFFFKDFLFSLLSFIGCTNRCHTIHYRLSLKSEPYKLTALVKCTSWCSIKYQRYKNLS